MLINRNYNNISKSSRLIKIVYETILELIDNTVTIMSRLINNNVTIDCSNIININIPNNILYRTQLICSSISNKNNIDFNLNNFITILFDSFIDKCIKQYNPDTILKMLIFNKNFNNNNNLVIKYNDISYNINNNNHNNNYIMNIELSDDINSESILILDEIYDLYGYKFTVSNLIESIWISYIEDYKKGINKRMYYKLNKLVNS